MAQVLKSDGDDFTACLANSNANSGFFFSKQNSACKTNKSESLLFS